MLYRRLVRALLILAALLALGGALAPAIASVAWPRYRVWSDLPLSGALHAPRGKGSLVARSVAGPDPWGRPWRVVGPVVLQYGWASDYPVQSDGPDGVEGGGDDVPVDPTMEVVAFAPQLSALLAVLLLWLAAVVRSLRGGRGPEAWHDLVRAVVAASLPAACVAATIEARGLPAFLGRGERLAVPLPVAVVGAAWLVLTLAALAWRVRRGVPRRRGPPRLGLAVVGGVTAVLAVVATLDGLRRREREGEERRIFANARLGRRYAVDRVLAGDPKVRDAYLALEPQLEWQHIADMQGVATLGSAANQYFARAMRWRGGVAGQAVGPMKHLLAHDPDLQALVAAWRAEPDRYQGMVLARPALVAALLGADEALELLRPLERAEPQAEGAFQPGLSSTDADDTRRMAKEAVRELASDRVGDDAWLVVVVAGTTPVKGHTRCALALEGEREEDAYGSVDEGPILVALGPLRASPAGRRLVVREELSITRARGRSLTVTLPALGAGETLWVGARLDTGASDVHRVPRASRAGR